MKKLIMVCSIFLLAQLAPAQSEAGFKEWIEKVPTVHAGAYYSLKDHAVNHSETFDIVSFNDMVFLEAGYAGDADQTDHKAIAALSLDIKQLKLKNYIKLPILDLVEFRPSLYAGLGDINVQDLNDARFDWGVGASLLSYKF